MNTSNIDFALPFKGTWLTFWGGDSVELNHHHDTPSQRYAFDFIVIDDNDSFFKTDGKVNEDYFSFGLDILAPADGEVVEVVDGLRDNKPKELNDFNFIGNYIMIKHAEKVYSVIGHLQRNSTLVGVGDVVKKGQKLALCGNSGYTTDPHLHFHVQNSSVFAKVDQNYTKQSVAKGVKIFFYSIQVNGKTEANHSPTKGEKVSN